MRSWDFRMVAYAGAKHPRIHLMHVGAELMKVSHAGLSAAQAEMMAFQARMKRGEVLKVDVYDLRGFGAAHGDLTQIGCDLAHPWKGMR